MQTQWHHHTYEDQGHTIKGHKAYFINNQDLKKVGPQHTYHQWHS